MYFLSENFAQAENDVQSFEIRGTLVGIRKRICVALSTGIKDTRVKSWTVFAALLLLCA